MRNRRHTTSYRPAPVLSAEQQDELRAELAQAAARNEHWRASDVAAWMSECLGRPVSYWLAWSYLVKLRNSLHSPGRSTHWLIRRSESSLKKRATPPKGRGYRLSVRDGRTVGHGRASYRTQTGAAAGVGASWPAPRSNGPARFAWRYVVGFVDPASGRTVFHLATSVNIPLFEAELAAFARAAGASPEKQIVLVLDRAGWHTSLRLWVPEHVHLLFLPPYSPELQPAEHLWPLTIRCSSTSISLRSMSSRRCNWHAVRSCSSCRRRSARRPVSIGGHARSTNDEDREEIA